MERKAPQKRRFRKKPISAYIRHCYGMLWGKLEECAKCKAKRWCAEAEDLPLMNLFSEKNDYKLDVQMSKEPEYSLDPPEDERPMYSKAELYELIGYIFALDYKTFEILAEKLGSPFDTLADIARKRKTTRQAMHSLVQRKIKIYPEIGNVVTFFRKRAHSYMPLPDELPEVESLEQLETHWEGLTELYEIKKEMLLKGGNGQ